MPASRSEDYFWSRFSKLECWVWQGASDEFGYGLVKWRNRKYRVHRLSYILKKGPIPTGYEIHHKCRNTLCGNPDHLQLVTRVSHPGLGSNQNTNKTHCKNGHEFSGWNLVLRKDGKRMCRICCRIQRLKWYRKTRQRG